MWLHDNSAAEVSVDVARLAPLQAWPENDTGVAGLRPDGVRHSEELLQNPPLGTAKLGEDATAATEIRPIRPGSSCTSLE